MIGYGRSEIFCVGGAAGVVVDEEVKAEAAAGALLPPVLGVDDADERPDDEGVTGGVVPELLLDRNQRRTQRLTRPADEIGPAEESEMILQGACASREHEGASPQHASGEATFVRPAAEPTGIRARRACIRTLVAHQASA